MREREKEKRVMSTILVAKEDHRSAGWRRDNIGSRLLQKMGWKDGEGLGRRGNGNPLAIRAVRRSGEDTLGIGASTEDTTGTQGWSQTTQHFSQVLSNLQQQQQHNDDGASQEKKKSDKKKKKKKKKTKIDKKTLVLARNKVTAGHAEKMRRSKDLSTKSAQDMAAIFGHALPPPPAPMLQPLAIQPRQEKEQATKTKSRKRRREENIEDEEDDNDNDEVVSKSLPPNDQEQPTKQPDDKDTKIPNEKVDADSDVVPKKKKAKKNKDKKKKNKKKDKKRAKLAQHTSF